MLDPRLNYLVIVARTGSFTTAAQEAGVTQSAVTRSIAALEREVGFPIFYRTPRGVIPTEKGGDFITRAARLLEDARELLRSGAGNKDPYSGVLRIGICPASLEWGLVEPLASLLRRHRGIRYDISSGGFETIVQHLRMGAIDVAVGYNAAFSEWSDLRREPMGSLDVALFVRRGHPLLGVSGPTLRDLARYDFVSPSDSRPYGEIIRNIFQKQGIDWHERVHRADFFPIVRSIVETSDAVGVVARSHAASPQFAERYQLLAGLDLFPTAPLCCAVRVRWEPKAATRALIGTLTRAFPLAQ
ncbi:LysR family transcriptional regulator [Novosphingobium sp. Gsoil 351]|uniref:LysR family transcriptional regulator n=1 Tax=Novosphingobium sp. Gsoil 351 TaxID=2675225 RepID=UPI0012B4D434|nr:LysR family transcriptional regulator [Novosphingobium sp. Gsoil 351]QGN55034.1 LysR family transcriptional regulator [Novosphingobium sp. Gsoil 351]